MAKEMKFSASFVEFAPKPVVPLKKVSSAPMLATIAEEKEAEEQYN